MKIKLLLTFLALCFFSRAMAGIVVDGINYEINNTKNTASVIRGSYSGAVVIPSSMTYNSKTYSVTSIGFDAFSACSGLTSITIPNSVKSIGSSAFRGCSGLASVTIPNSVTSIGGYAFKGCSGLTSITIPNSVTSIDRYAFYGCSGLASVTIPNSVTSIGRYAFSNCQHLCEAVIGTGVTSIGSGIFSNTKMRKLIWLPNTPPSGYTNVRSSCHYVSNNKYTGLSNTTIYPLLGSMFEVDGIKYVPVNPAERTCDAISCRYDSTNVYVKVGNTVNNSGVEMKVNSIAPYFSCNNNYIESVAIEHNGDVQTYAFSGCDNLATVTISDGVTSIGSSAFGDCSSLASITIPNSVTSIGQSTFSGCSGLTSITISDSVTTIGNSSFYNCTNLKDISMGSGVQSIGDWAFFGCASIESFSFGANVKSIGKEAFSGCTALTSLVSLSKTPPTCGSNAFSDINKWECTLHILAGTTALYAAAEQWRDFFFVSEDATGINDARADNDNIVEQARYNLGGQRINSGQGVSNGQRINNGRRGLNIIRMSDGTTKKVLVK